jgi:hypothetical protein
MKPAPRAFGLLLGLPLFVASTVACGPTPPVQTPPPPPTGATAPTAANYKDPTESEAPIRMTPLFGAGAPAPTFPKATLSDIGCLGQATLTGDHDKDYPLVVKACGTPTGLAEYAKPVTGMLHSMFDKHDSYVVALAPGYCYRVLAVADQSIFDLGLSVQPVAGGPATQDGARGSVAMVDDDKPLCVDVGGDYAITLAIEGMGYGGYTLGIWARPKS